VDLDVMAESAVAIAQARIHDAMKDAGISRAELARRLDINRAFITKLFRSDYSMTVRTFARVMAACGYQTDFAPTRIEDCSASNPGDPSSFCCATTEGR
jgi:transcriptional regulator with XRE-family HTH domain